MQYNSLDALSKKLNEILGQVGQIDRLAKGIGGTGSRGGGVMSGSLAPVSTVATALTAGGQFLTAAAGTAAGVSSMMPNVNSVMARESGIYGAGVASGGMMSRGRLESNTRLGLGKFMNIENATGVVSGILTTRGMAPTSAEYGSTVRSVGQAARLMNMSNDVAAQAFEGFGSGPTSAMLMRNFGIATSDTSGKSMGQNAIFQQLKARFTGGRSANLQQTMDSLRKGALGSNIRNSGLDSAQQAILSQQFIASAMGMNLDFSDSKSVDKVQAALKAQGFENPFNAQMELTSKNDQLAETATKPYLQGINDAKDALIALKDFTNDKLIPTFGRLKATIDTFTGDNTGGGAVTAGGSMLGGALAIGATVGTSMLLRGKGGNVAGKIAGFLGKGTAGTTAATSVSTRSAAAKAASAYGTKGGGAKGSALTKLGLKGSGLLSLAGLALDTPGNIEQTNAGYGGSAWGSSIGAAAGGIAGAALGQTLIPIPVVGAMLGGFAGSMAGGWLGGMAGSMFDKGGALYQGGPASSVRTGGTSVGVGSTGGMPNLKAPVNGVITCRWGVRDKMHPNGHHGTDFGVSEGTPVGAAGDGRVSAVYWSNALGNVVEIDHGGGYSTKYAHLNQSLVSVGMEVKQGQIIAKSGNTGSQTTGAHLHFEIRKGGQSINPSPWLGGGAVDLIGGLAEGTSNVLTGLTGSTAASNAISGFVEDILGMNNNAGSAVKLPSSYSGAGYVSSSQSMGNKQTLGRSRNGTGTVPSSGVGGGGYVPNIQDTFANGMAKAKESHAEAKHVENNVTIQVSIASASASEAKKFAEMVKDLLEKENSIHKVGAK